MNFRIDRRDASTTSRPVMWPIRTEPERALRAICRAFLSESEAVAGSAARKRSATGFSLSKFAKSLGFSAQRGEEILAEETRAKGVC